MRKGAHWFTVLVAVGTLALMSLPTGAQAGSTQRYLVLYKSTQVPASAASDISAAGGTLVYSYDAIGVALAESSSASFADSMGASNKVEGVGATGGLGI
ncbi:MAG TPA: hypothetical protein VEO00_01230, partial [Actinomycetota bacterium]|nr:hypothetical protein [Actinomycetota bacterium]